jgi:hypothetical protein
MCAESPASGARFVGRRFVQETISLKFNFAVLEYTLIDNFSFVLAWMILER